MVFARLSRCGDLCGADTGSADDESFASRMEGPLVAIGLLMVGMFFLGACHASLLGWSAERQSARLRSAYLRAVLVRDQSWYDLTDAPTLPSRMAEECHKVTDAIGPKLGLVVVPFGQMGGGFAIALYYGWKLALVIFQRPQRRLRILPRHRCLVEASVLRGSRECTYMERVLESLYVYRDFRRAALERIVYRDPKIKSETL